MKNQQNPTKRIFVILVFMVSAISGFSQEKLYGTPKISTSPDNFFTWKNTGTIVNGSTVVKSEKAAGYVVTSDGVKHEGEISVTKHGQEMKNVFYFFPGGKEKFKAKNVSKYGLSGSVDDYKNIEKLKSQGVVYTNAEVTMKDGSVDQGSVAIADNGASLSYLAEGQEIISLKPEDVKNVTAGDKSIAPLDGLFMEVAYAGDRFILADNPNPTHLNAKASVAAAASLKMAAGLAVGAAAKQENEQLGKTTIRSVIDNSSNQELEKMVNAMKQQRSSKLRDKRLMAIQASLAKREADKNPPKIYYKEYFLKRTGSKSKMTLYKPVYEQLMSTYLENCAEFSRLEDKEKKKLFKWKNRMEAVKMLDNCS